MFQAKALKLELEIMNRIFLKLKSVNPKSGSTLELTVKQWLNRDPEVKGYSTAEAFIPYAESLRESEVEQLDQCFTNFKNGLRIVGNLVTRLDKANRPYQHPGFLQGNATIGCKVILEAGMKEFLQDYIAGKVSIKFTLEELIEEALNG